MSKPDEIFTLVSIRGTGDGNWGWPDKLVLTLRNMDGEEREAFVCVDFWRKPIKQSE
jgi:hypothetical protein